jgi:hypothetical protein
LACVFTTVVTGAARVSGDIDANIASVSFKSNSVSTNSDLPSPTINPALL